MKIKEGYLLRQVAGKWVVLSIGIETLNFNGMLTINESGRLLWQALENGCGQEELTRILTENYEVSQEQAQLDVDEFIDKLMTIGCIEK